MIADAAEAICGPAVQVQALMGPGVDPHLYKATQGDLQILYDADLIVYNGLHLEGKLGEVLENVARSKPVVSLGEKLPQDRLLAVDDSDKNYDPHIWFDVALWSAAVQALSDTLQLLYPEQAELFKANTIHYRRILDTLHRWVSYEINAIPEQQRTLVTAHDAFGYFGRAYGIEVRGLQGISTVADFGLRDVANLVDTIIARRVKAVFVESSVSTRAIEAVLEGCRERGHELALGGELYSDAMGAEGSPEGTYTGMLKSNVHTIVGALR